MRNKVDFEFTKDWGLTKKGTKKSYKKPLAGQLEKEGRGKIVRKPKPKAVKPAADKVEKAATKRATK
jgi:hypothetical protein